jgi:hypothetical protein
VCSSDLFEDLIIIGSQTILVVDFTNQEHPSNVLGKVYITDSNYSLVACVDEPSTVYDIDGVFTVYHIVLDNVTYYSSDGIYANGGLVQI